MTTPIIIGIVGLLLLVFALIDIKTRQIPSIITTGLIFVLMMVFPQNLFLGIASLVFAIILYEGEFITGLADIKCITIVGLMLSTYSSFFIMILCILFLGLGYKIILKNFVKAGKNTEIPFIPIILITYGVLALSHLI